MRQYLKFSQRVQIYNFIKTVGQTNGEHWEYNEGWNDARVAEQFKYSVGNVSTVRMELGKLRTAPNAPFALKMAKMEERLFRLETDFTTKIAELERKLNAVNLSTKFRVNS